MSLRDSVFQELPPKQQAEYQRFEQVVLKEHIKHREGKEGATCILDRRNAFLGRGKRETLRCPYDKGWPDHGRTTKDLELAREWAKSHYIPQLWQQRQAESIHPTASHRTWKEGAERLVKSYESVRRDRNGREIHSIPDKYKSRVSMIRQHVLPAFRSILMAGTTRTMVREEAEALTITRINQNDVAVRTPAALGTKLNFVRAMTAIWNYNFPDVTAPFAGAVIRSPAIDTEDIPTSVYDLSRIQDELRAEEGKGGLSPSEVRRALIGAMHRDSALLQRPNVAAGEMIPNTAYLFAILVALGVRISEARRIRWGDIDFKSGFILIHQSKLHTNKRAKPKPKLRVVPLQESLRPWLEELRIAEGISDPAGSETFVIRTSRKAPGNKAAAQSTLGARATKTLLYAGVKPDGYATHWGRATHASWGKHAEGLKAEELRHFLGHEAFKGSTEYYVTMLVELLRDEHRRYIALPTPDEVRAELEQFEPSPFDWREHRTWKSRSKKAREERRLRRLARETLGTSLEFRPVRVAKRRKY